MIAWDTNEPRVSLAISQYNGEYRVQRQTYLAFRVTQQHPRNSKQHSENGSREQYKAIHTSSLNRSNQGKPRLNTRVQHGMRFVRFGWEEMRIPSQTSWRTKRAWNSLTWKVYIPDDRSLEDKIWEFDMEGRDHVAIALRWENDKFCRHHTYMVRSLWV